MICPTCGHDNLPGIEVCFNCQQDLTALDRPSADNRVARRLMEELARSIKSDLPTTIPLTATIGDAIQRLLDANVGALLVVDERGVMQGIFTERDLLKRIVGIVDNYRDLPVRQFMTQRPESVAASDTLNYVLHKMDGGGYRHVPVIDGDKPISVISVRDMLQYLTKLCREES